MYVSAWHAKTYANLFLFAKILIVINDEKLVNKGIVIFCFQFSKSMFALHICWAVILFSANYSKEWDVYWRKTLIPDGVNVEEIIGIECIPQTSPLLGKNLNLQMVILVTALISISSHCDYSGPEVTGDSH